MIWLSAITASSPISFGLISLRPGMSSAVSTATTPGAARTGSRSSVVTRPAAIGAKPGARCSVPAGIGSSSI